LIDEALAGTAPWAEVVEVPAVGLEPRREKVFRRIGNEAGGEGMDYALLDCSWKSSLQACLKRAVCAETIAHPTGLVPEIETSRRHPSDRVWKNVEVEGGRGFDIGRKVGVLVHKLLEISDLDDSDELEALAKPFAADLGLDRAAIRSAMEMIRGFGGTPLADRVRRAKCVHREVPFCVRLADLPVRDDQTGSVAGITVGAAAKAGITVEGTADLLLEEEDGWCVVDFKTDKVEANSVAERAAHYRLQGACYALCLSTVIGRPIKEVVFYFLKPQVSHAFEADDAFLGEAKLALAEELRSSQ
jgi:hypothetical protein